MFTKYLYIKVLVRKAPNAFLQVRFSIPIIHQRGTSSTPVPYQSNDERSERLVTSDNSIQFLLQGGFEEYQSNYKPHYTLVN